MDISGWLNETITVRHRTGLGADGNPTYATSADVAARIERRTRAVLNAGGEQIEASHMITVLTEVEEEDGILLPGETDYRRAVAVNRGLDKVANVTHYEVWL